MRAGLAALLLMGCAARQVPDATVTTSSTPGPLEMKLPLFPNGPDVDLAAVRGNVVLLDVWATWCEPCKDSLPIYERLIKEYEGRNLKVYAINVDADRAQVTKFVKETGVAVPILYDRDALYSERALQIQLMPTYLLLDRHGIVRKKHEGFEEGFAVKLRADIDGLLAEK
ncbi:MAG: TlpA family protein disulfide reductase [Myxococcaceae bacterium]